MYKKLRSKSSFLTEFHPVAEKILVLSNGGYELEAEDYLLIRDDEDKKITEKRKSKFAPRNVLGAALKYLRISQESGVVDIDLSTLPGDENLWAKFLNNVDGGQKTIKEFVIDVFEQAIKIKYGFVKVDLPYLDIPSDLNQTQAESIQVSDRRLPFLSQIPLSDVLNFSEKDGELQWIKYKWIEAVEDPYSETKYNYHIFVIDNTSILEFCYENVVLDDDGCIKSIWDATLKRGKGGYRDIKDNEPVTWEKDIAHERGSCPVIKFEIPDSLWQSNQVYQTQAVIYGLHMNMLHTLSNAGFVQKWGKPYVLGGGGSGGVSIAPMPNDVIKELVDKYAKHMGDESIMMMEQFSFEELRGDSINIQQEIISELAEFVFNSIVYKQNIVSNVGTTVQAQSGLSKEFDRESQTMALKANGSKIVALTQSILKKVAKCFPGITDDQVLQISVEGMNTFNLRPVSNALDTVERLANLPDGKIPAPIMQESLKQLAIALLDNSSQEEKQRVIEEIDSMPITTNPLVAVN